MRFRPDRRTLLLGAAGIALASKIGAAPPALSVPQVDELSLTILDDKETFGPFLPDQDRAGLAIRYAGNGGGPGESEMKKRALTGEFGLSILAASRVGDTHRKVLVDFGYSPEVLANNMALLGIDPSTIDAAVLSHGHLDHYGGSPR